MSAPRRPKEALHPRQASGSLGADGTAAWSALRVTIFANPTHRCDVGLKSCACSPTMP